MNTKGYFDYNATTPVDPRVLAEMMPYFSERFANPSSAYRQAGEVLAAIEKGRRQAARLINASPAEIVFTSGGTESDNLAIFGCARSRRHRGNHLITSAVEHEAVLAAFRKLEKEGFRLTVLPVDGSGLVDADDLRRVIRTDTIIISVMHANNETGVIQPIRDLAAIAKDRGIPFHTDAVQSAGKIPVDVHELGVDLLSLSGHKIYGPKGAGVLFVRDGLALAPMLVGGGQEKGMRSGTENVPGIVGLGKAAELAIEEMTAESSRLKLMRDRLQRELTAKIPGVLVNGDVPQRLANTLNLSFPHCEGEVLVSYLDQQGLALSAGSACSARSRTPSHVLLAMGRNPEEAGSSLRISLGRFSRDEDIVWLLQVLPRIVHRLQPPMVMVGEISDQDTPV